jgi:cbb3-type cytochrome oxidase subunit 3
MTDANSEIQKTLRRASPFIILIARAGYSARALVYALIGSLTLWSALGMRRSVADYQSVMKTILSEPLGRYLLIAIAAGLAGYALWCLILAIFNPENFPDSWKGLGRRFGFFFVALVHVFLVWYALSMLIGWDRGDSRHAAQAWTQYAMTFPLGRLIVAGAGIGFFIFSIVQLYLAVAGRLDSQLNLWKLDHTPRTWAKWVSRVGVGARAFVFAMIGLFLLVAAWYQNPHEAKGFAQALGSLRHHAHGAILLSLVAAGLIAFGIYEAIRAFFREISPA